MGTFQGHQIVSIIGEIFLCLWIIPLIILFRLKKAPKIGRRMKLGDYLIVYFFWLFIPNSVYAIFEFRHLLPFDNISIHLDLWSFIVFGGITFLGLLTMLYGCRLIIDRYAKTKKERRLYQMILSVTGSLGATAGLVNYTSFVAFFHPLVLFSFFLELFSHPALIAIAITGSIVIFMLFLLVDILSKYKENQMEKNCPADCTYKNFHVCMFLGTHCATHCTCKCAECEAVRKKAKKAKEPMVYTSTGFRVPAKFYPSDCPNPPSEPE